LNDKRTLENVRPPLQPLLGARRRPLAELDPHSPHTQSVDADGGAPPSGRT